MSWKHMVCGQCQEPFQIAEETYQALVRSSATFHCPWGHKRHFPQGPTETDKLRLERDRLRQDAARLEDEKRIAWATANQQREFREAAERRASAARGQVTKLKNRASAGVCPCCNRSFENLRRHMAAKHAGFTAEPVAEGATIQ